MESQIKTAYVLADQEAPYENNDFSVIMELSQKEKRELISIWKNRRANER